MAVYVDNLSRWGIGYRGPGAAQATRVGARNDNLWCHMTATTEAELHSFAVRLGLRTEWFQDTHYDLTPGKRIQALRAGAIEVDRRGMVQRIREFRARKDSRPAP